MVSRYSHSARSSQYLHCVQNHGEAVLYADIGPSSFTNRPQISEITLGLDDHVEYAQLNQHLLTVKLDQIMVASCTGKRYEYTVMCAHII